MAVALTSCSQANDEPADPVAASPGLGEDLTAQDGWRRMARSPLSARVPGVAVWTGTEMLVVGGSSTTPCGSGTDCFVELDPLADGAAYDPAIDTWRSVSPSPVAFVHGDAVWTGTEVLVVASRTVAGDARMLLSYDPAIDQWTRRADSPQAGLRDPVWTGDAWLFASQNTFDGGGDWRYEPGTDTWQRLPADPIGPAHDRRLVWTGEETILFASVFDVDGLPVNGFWEVAALLDGQWRPLPAPAIVNNGNRWISAGRFVVNPTEGFTEEISGETHPFSGVLDISTDTWSKLPEPSPLSPDHRGSRTGFVGDADGWVVTDQRLFDPETGRWHEVMPRPDAVYPGAAVWTGTEILTWGGFFEDESLTSSPELSATGFAYRPPSR